MAEQRSLREIMLLPDVEREKESRLTPAQIVPKKALLSLLAVLALCLAGFFVYQSFFMVTVPNVVGASSDIAELTLKQKGLEARIVERRFSAEKQGVVIEQSPQPQQKYAKSASVKLVISGGTEEVIMPNLLGDNELYSTRVLTQKGLVPVIVEEPSEQPEGTVLSTIPAQGERVYTGDSITLRVSGKRQSVVLHDYDLSGKKVAIVPVYSPLAENDPTYDIARRLSALIKAAGGEPVIARSGGDKKNHLSDNERTQSDALIWITTRKTGANGIIVSAQKASLIQKNDDKISVASAIAHQLIQNTTNVRTATSVFSDATRPQRLAKVSIGSLENLSDKTLIKDAQYKDVLAQSIYMGIGAYLAR